MIGFVLRGLGFGIPGASTAAVGIGSAVACCALWGICKCARCRARQCCCVKRWMRCTGCDPFDDFEMLVIVHEALFTKSEQKMTTAVKVKAGDQQAQTDKSTRGLFQQPLSIFVEQGTEQVRIELVDSGARVLATLQLDPIKDVLYSAEPCMEKLFTMKQKSKHIINPRIKLSIHLDKGASIETGLLSGLAQLGVSEETDLMLRQQLHKVGAASTAEEKGAEGPSEVQLLVKGCAGPLEMFGSWGTKKNIYIGVLGPPAEKRYKLCAWKDQAGFEKQKKPELEVDLLKVEAVQPDPGRVDCFSVIYYDAARAKRRLLFRRVDRHRDVWIEMFQIIITKIRAQRDEMKGPETKKKREP